MHDDDEREPPLESAPGPGGRVEYRDHTPLPATVPGRASIEWLENGAFLRVHSEMIDPRFPVSTAIVGVDDDQGTYSFIYHDSRGVSRILDMSLDGSVWTLERLYAPFSQRFTGTLSPDGRKITATWEKSIDGDAWERDFDMVYTKAE